MTDIQNRMINDYLSGTSAREASERAGYKNHHPCYQALREAGIPRRTRADYRTDNLNTTYFSSIDSEEKSYWLGFLTADGNVSKTRITLGLSGKDGDHVQKFANAVGTSLTVRWKDNAGPSKNKSCALISVYSRRMTDDLARHNIIPKKSLICKPSSLISDELIGHYWRGVFDGDGCLRRQVPYKSGGFRWGLDLCGNKAMTDGFAAWVEKSTGHTMWKKPHGNVWYVGCCGTGKPGAIARALYENSTVHLDRKKVLSEELLRQWQPSLST